VLFPEKHRHHEPKVIIMAGRQFGHAAPCSVDVRTSGRVGRGCTQGVYMGVCMRVCTRVLRRLLPFYAVYRRYLPFYAVSTPFWHRFQPFLLCFCTVSAPFPHCFISFVTAPHCFISFVTAPHCFITLPPLPHCLLLYRRYRTVYYFMAEPGAVYYLWRSLVLYL